MPEIKKIKGENPCWGIRRVYAYLRKYVSNRINHKGIALLMKSHGLTVPRNRQLRARREARTHKPVTAMPNTVWGTNMAKTRIGDGWTYVHVVIDWGTLGDQEAAGAGGLPTSRSSDWKRALDKAVNLQFPDEILRDDPYELVPSIVSDNGCQPTSKEYSDYERSLELEHIFTNYCNPKGDADTERVIRTLKEDLLWINEFGTLEKLQVRLAQCQHDYNWIFPHSSLEYCTPAEYEDLWNRGMAPQNTRAMKILRDNPLFQFMN